MKKFTFLIYILVAVFCGLLFGRIFFSDYNENSLTVFNEGKKTYFVSIGVYSNDSIDFKNYLSIEDTDGFHIYTGISSSKKIAKKIKDYYETLGNNVSIEEKYINNYDFISILNEYDKITDITDNNNDLINIEKIIISNYKEMVVLNES